MRLSVRERVALHRVESQLSREDLALALYLASGSRRRFALWRAGFLLRVVLPMLVGVQVTVTGGMAGSGLLTVAVLLYAVLAPCGALLVAARRN